MNPYAIAIVGNSGAGKTTLLERLIPALKQKGLRVGVVKHDAHRFEIDHPGKEQPPPHRGRRRHDDDHFGFEAGGGEAARRLTPDRGSARALFQRHGSCPRRRLRGSSLPKIEVHRKEFHRALICRGERNDLRLAAVASDEPLDLDVPVLDLNDPRRSPGSSYRSCEGSRRSTNVLPADIKRSRRCESFSPVPPFWQILSGPGATCR